MYIIYNTSNKEIIYKNTNYNQILNIYNQTYVKDNQYQLKTTLKVYDDFLHIKDSGLPQDKMWRDTFNGVRRALRFLDSPESIVTEYTRWTGMPSAWLIYLLHCPVAITVQFLKKVKEKIHQNMNYLPPELRYYFDLETLSGYPSMKDRAMTDDPYAWLTQDSISTYNSQWWKASFQNTFAESVTKSPTHILTLKEFTLCRWMWVTEGASNFSLLELNGDKVKTKLGAAVSLTDQRLLNLVFNTWKVNDPTNTIKVFIKPDEKGYKRRLIANVQLGFYIVAAYIRYVLNQFTGSEPNFMKLSPNINDHLDITTLLKEGRVFYPLDESAYDYHVTNEAWSGFIGFLEDSIPDKTAVYLFKHFYGHAIWQFENQSGIWKSGMPSGLALTSYVNSWMNFIKQTTLLKGPINWAAGDDVLACPYVDNVSLKDIEKHYDSFGSVANATKNWTSWRYAEYLKVFYTKFGTSGYTSRIFSSLIWAGTDRFFLPADRMNELFDLFKQFFDRVGIHMPERYVAADLSRSVHSKLPNFNISKALEYMHSPKIHGGLGKYPYNNKTFTWKIEKVESSIYQKALIRMPRVLKFYGRVTLIEGTYKFKKIAYKLGKPYKLQEIKSIEEWEKRLNREDIDYHGPFQNLILDVIPLPVVDFISTAKMSNYAEMNMYNAYPNLHGNWNSIANRLLSASLGLLDNMFHTLYVNRINVFT